MTDSDINVVALTPAEMVPAQHNLIAWCDRKVRALGDERAELELHQKLALENGWKTSVVVANLNRTLQRITYYEKMRAALQAGYLLVPNMPVDVLAVRVARERPTAKTTGSRWRSSQAAPDVLPAGEGRYVDNLVDTDELTVKRTNAAGHEYNDLLYTPTAYDDEVDFPIAMTKPVVLEAAARAMALKVFDQIGRVQNGGGGDPILVGQLIDRGRRGRTATFLIAWWLDTRTL